MKFPPEDTSVQVHGVLFVKTVHRVKFPQSRPAPSVGAVEASVSGPRPAGMLASWNMRRPVLVVRPIVLFVSCTVVPARGAYEVSDKVMLPAPTCVAGVSEIKRAARKQRNVASLSPRPGDFAACNFVVITWLR